jgi:hypothetical protein
MEEKDPNYIHTSKEILKVLSESKEEGKSVGILSPRLGPSILVTAVEEILQERDRTTIVFKQYDHTGYILPRYKIDIQDILSVYPFKSQFKNPFLDNFIKDRTGLY